MLAWQDFLDECNGGEANQSDGFRQRVADFLGYAAGKAVCRARMWGISGLYFTLLGFVGKRPRILESTSDYRNLSSVSHAAVQLKKLFLTAHDLPEPFLFRV